MKVLVAQSYTTVCNPMSFNLPVSSVHGIPQARILEWIAVSLSRGSFWPRDWTWISWIADRFCTMWATREAQWNVRHSLKGRKFWHVIQHRWPLKTLCWVEVVSHKRTYIVWFQLYPVIRGVKFIEIESRAIVARGWGETQMGRLYGVSSWIGGFATA